MKKQLSILAGSVLLASSAQAAITAGDAATDSSAILVLTGSLGSFVVDTGISAGDLATGTGFSVSIAGADAAVGGITGYALFGALAADGGTAALGYADAGFGYVAAGGANPLLAGDLQGLNDQINTYIGNTSAGGFFAAGTLQNLPNNTWAAANTLVQNAGDVTQIFTSTETAVSTDGVVSGPIDILGPNAAVEGAYIGAGDTFNVTNEQTVIPVPAAAWLFGSALVGLGVVRRK